MYKHYPTFFQVFCIRIFWLVLFFASINSKAQTVNFNWFNGTAGHQWTSANQIKTFNIPWGAGCKLNVPMEIIDTNNRNGDPNILTTHPYGNTNGSFGWLANRGFPMGDAGQNPHSRNIDFSIPPILIQNCGKETIIKNKFLIS